MVHSVSVFKAPFDNEGAVVPAMCPQNWSPCKTQPLTEPGLLQQVLLLLQVVANE